MVQSGKDYALGNKFSILKLEEALIFGREHHKDKCFVEDWVVEKACDMERKQGAVEELERILDFFKKERFSIIFTDKLKNKLEERLKELKERGV